MISKKNFRYTQYGLILFLIILPIIIFFGYIYLFGVDVFFWDEWKVYPELINKTINNSLDFNYLFSQHNEHRMFFPKIMYLGMGLLTSFNTKMLMYVGGIFVFLTFIMIFLEYKRQFGLTKKSLLFFIPIPYLMFSLAQRENILWSFQSGWFFMLFFIISTFIFLIRSVETTNKKTYFSLSLISGIVASFCSMQGLFVWPIGFLFLLYLFMFKRIEKNESIKKIIIWLITGVLVFTLYFINYIKPNGIPSLFVFLKQPSSAINFFLIVIGNPLTSSFNPFKLAWICGIIIFIVMVFCLFMKKEKKEFFLPILLILFSILFAFSVTVSRLGFGIKYSYTSRYATFITLGVIGAYLFLLNIIKDKKKISFKKILFGIWLLFIILSICFSYYHGFQNGKQTKNSRLIAARTLLNIDNTTDEIIKKRLGPNPEIVRMGSKILRDNNLSVFKVIDKKSVAPNFKFKMIDITLNSSKIVYMQN